MAQVLSSSGRRRRGLPALIVAMLALAVAGAISAWWWQDRSRQPAGIDPRQRAAIEGVVRDYILTHPDILPEAMARLQAGGTAKRIAAQNGLTTPFPGAVLGNPAGSLTLVQFTDYACTYCRQSVADLRALAAAHPNLRIVVRELPILSPASEDAARMALSAARQGRYAAFHNAMFAGEKPDARSIARAAGAAGLDPAGAASLGRSGDISAELARNLGFARALGIQGTPAWVVGDRLLVGAVGLEALEQALAEAGGAST